MAFEIDPAYCAILRERFDGRPLRVVAGDVLKTWRAEAAAGWGWVLGNLPYNIAGTLLGDWAEAGPGFPAGVFLVQRELAQRMAAQPRTKAYSSFSVLCQTAYTVEHLFDVPPAHFYPRPEVTSTALRLRPRVERPVQPARFAAFLRLCFRSRRKTLGNALAAVGELGLDPGAVQGAFRREGIPLTQRPEEVPPTGYAAVWEAVAVSES